MVPTVYNCCSELVSLVKENPLTLGFSLFCSWMYVAFFSDILVSAETVAAMGRYAHVLPSSVANLAALIAIAMLAKRFGPFCTRRLSCFMISLVGCLGTFAVYAASLLGAGASIAATDLGAILTGVGSAWVIALWGEAYASLEDSKSGPLIILSEALGILVYVVLTALPRSVAAGLSCLLLPACAAAAVGAYANAPSLPIMPHVGSAQEWVSKVWRIILVVFLFGTVFWASPKLSAAQPVGSVIIAASGFLAAVVIATDVLVIGHLSMNFVYRVVLPLMLLGLLLTIAGEGAVGHGVGPILAMSAFTCLDYFAYVTYSHASRDTGFMPAAGYALGHCATSASIPVGWILSTYVSDRLIDSFGEFTCVFIVAIILVVASGIVIADVRMEDLPSDEGENVTAILTSAALFARQCEYVIEKYQLSKREEQVLLLTTRGRSTPFIAKRLNLSTSTIKKCITHLYEKLGVSDRQGMVDLIEGVDPMTPLPVPDGDGPSARVFQ